MTQKKAPYNRTLELSEEELVLYRKELASLAKDSSWAGLVNKVIHQ
ncbi:MAG: hypothetical protein HRT89_02045, partial [Lentisphaeria bacterium]|nr:hypothetical protein [Lentisphaeria bacterium]